MEQLTPFQKTCQRKLEQAVSVTGNRLDVRETQPGYPVLDGERSVYIHCWVEDTPIEIWIYTDGAEFSTPERSWIFEAPDYDSPEELIEAFIRGVADRLSSGKPAA
jgi:hypothetical protein